MKVKGSITVFLCIILCVLIAFSGLIVDLSRLRTGEKHAQAAVQVTVQSVLSQYHAPLKEQYGLMTVGREQEELEKAIFELLEKNLAVENRYTPGIIDLYGFEVRNVTVTPCFNMTEDFVLEQQITQFMKYRAPVNTIGNFIEKLRALNTFMAQSGLLNKKMEFEKSLQKIREEQVYLSILLPERIHGFSNHGKPGKEIEEKLSAMLKNLNDINAVEEQGGRLDTSWREMQDIIPGIAEAREEISSVESEKEALKTELKSRQRKYDEIESQMRGVKSGDERLSRMKTELSGLDTEIGSIEDRISVKDAEIGRIDESIRQDMERLQSNAGICLSALSEVRAMMESAYDCLLYIQQAADRYVEYHRQALQLIDEIDEGCKKARKLSEEIDEEIAKQSEQSDNAFLTRIKSDVKKLVLNADPGVLQGIRAETESNLNALLELSITIGSTEMVYADELDNLDFQIEKTKAITENRDCSEREAYGGKLEEAFSVMKGQLDIKAGEYKKPVYAVEPAVNKKERDEFARWCNRVFNEKNDAGSGRDKGYQKKLKQNMEKSDQQSRAEQKEFKGSDSNLSDSELNELFSSLPSYRDKNGNYPNVVSSEQASGDMEEELLLPAGEEGNKDIEQSYGDSLDRNGSFASKIGKVLSDAGDKLIKSLYVNEYIVSAFKNVNIDTVPAPGIRTGGRPDKTFFEKAEAEYIIFGARREKTNANLARLSIFGIRMGLNLIHVYTNSDKTATALAAATAIAGWTGFGVPIVKNLVILGWAAGESWMDVRDINDGKDVPVYKTKNTWKLDLKSIFSGIAGEFIDESSGWLKKSKDDLIDRGDDALQTMVEDMVSSGVHEVFLPVEQAITELGEEWDAVSGRFMNELSQPDELAGLEDLKGWIADTAREQFDSVKNEALGWTKLKLEDYKKKITEKILECLFKSPAYQNLISRLKKGLNDIIDSSADKLSESIKKLGNSVGDTGDKSQLVGTVVSFDYTDYLRLLLLIVPQRIKLLRIADLLQMNMAKTLDNPDFMLSGHNTFLIVEADISMKYLFIPAIFNREGKGQISIRWGYGY